MPKGNAVKKAPLEEGDVVMTESGSVFVYLGRYANRKRAPLSCRSGPVPREGRLYAEIRGCHGSYEEAVDDLLDPDFDLCTAVLVARPKKYENLVGHLDLARYGTRLLEIRGLRKLESGKGSGMHA